MKKTKIFVDGNCVVCDWEISHYARLAPEAFEIVDINDSKFDSSAFGMDFEEVNVNLHVLTPDGQIKIGVDAFAHIWGRVERYGFAKKLIETKTLNPLAQFAYKIFTKIRPYLPKKNR